MQRHRDGERSDLVGNTIIDTLRSAFTIVLAIVVPLVTAVVIFASIDALRDRLA
jgi:hypothetical protein